jgi:NAD(P)-dependent dehydrogenase (short-subunit alcohol dehydrogenase family)
MTRRSRFAQGLFAEMMQLFEQRKLTPLAHRSFPPARIVEGFRHMQLSEHIGKIVVSFDDRPLPVAPSPARVEPLVLRADASYLVVGGLSGFGLETARWLVEKGARTLLLAGRGGLRSDEACSAVAELTGRGVTVHVLSVDVTDGERLSSALAPCGLTWPPLRGVVHAAMVQDDAVVSELTGDRIEKVLAPEILGARNLHEATRESPLDFFVMYSSATTLFGNPGQASSAAANVYLEALARLRRQEGKPGLAVAWGALSDVGLLARDPSRDHPTSRIGDAGLTSREALGVLEGLIATGEVAVAVTRLDWSRLLGALPSSWAPRYRAVARRFDAPVQGD